MGSCGGKSAKASSNHASVEEEAASPAKFQIGKSVSIDVPRSVGPPLSELRGQKGSVKKSWMTAEGRVYSIIIGGYVTGDDIKTVEVKEEWLSRAGMVANSSNVKSLPLLDIFKACSVHRIPTFQRRYCWVEVQWRRLWKSIEAVRDNPKLNNHSLERLMLLQQKDGARLVLDGQQRLTTTSLMLSALCDRLVSLGEAESAKTYRLYCEDGRLVPTMYDRPDFKRCLAERFPEGDSNIVRAKHCFSKLAEVLNQEMCLAMTEALLNRVSMLAFVVDNESAMQSIFEKIAVRTEIEEKYMGEDFWSCVSCFTTSDGNKESKATHWSPEGDRICADCAAKMPGSTAMTRGIPMSPIDVIRNFVFDHYPNDEMMKAAYEKYWGPMELNAGEDTKTIEASLSAFLEAQGFPVKQRWGISEVFMTWWGSPSIGDNAADFADGKLQELLQSVKK